MTAPSLPTTAPACNPMDPNHAPWRRAVGSAHQNASVNQNPGSDSQRRVGGGELRLVDRTLPHRVFSDQFRWSIRTQYALYRVPPKSASLIVRLQDAVTQRLAKVGTTGFEPATS